MSNHVSKGVFLITNRQLIAYLGQLVKEARTNHSTAIRLLLLNYSHDELVDEFLLVSDGEGYSQDIDYCLTKIFELGGGDIRAMKLCTDDNYQLNRIQKKGRVLVLNFLLGS